MYDNVHLIHLLQTNAVTRKVSISFRGSCYLSRPNSEYPTTVRVSTGPWWPLSPSMCILANILILFELEPHRY